MELTQPEIIQLLRRRTGMNQGTFGKKAFTTSYESGRTKVKNIELGKQVPTTDDLKNMARVLGVGVHELTAEPAASDPMEIRHEKRADKGLVVLQKVLDMFPGLEAYLEMLNKAALLDDEELIGYISEKVSGLLVPQPKRQAINS